MSTWSIWDLGLSDPGVSPIPFPSSWGYFISIYIVMFIYIHYMSSTVVHVTGILTVRPWSPGGPPHLGIGLLPPSPLAVGVLAGLRKMGKTWGFHRPFSCLDLYIPLDSRHCCSFLPSFNWKTWTMTVGRRGHRSQEHKPQIWVCPLRPVIPWGHRARSIAVEPMKSSK